MRHLTQSLARRWWSGQLGASGALLTAFATPLSWLWSLVTALRNERYDRNGGETVRGLTVLSVGNLAVGGTGKTPIASWLAQRVRDAGYRPAVVLSGYGVDEQRLHERWTPELPVLAARARVTAAREALRRGSDVAVLDDGFQHRRLARSLDLVVLAAEDQFPGRILPAGPYREGPKALRRAHVAVVSRRTAGLEAARELAERLTERHPQLVTGGVRLTGGTWFSLSGGATEVPDGDVLAVAAIGRPDLFHATVSDLVPGTVDHLSFADHHAYDRRDVAKIVRRAAGRPVVMTEKDAVKLAAFESSLPDVRVLAQQLAWDWGEESVWAAVRLALGGDR